jgi:uncharacterized protein (DUF433 family)
MNAPLITSDPQIMVGKPVIAGTRISVELVLEKMAAGDTIEDLIDAYPHLTREGIQAAIEFAREAVSMVSLHPVSIDA